MNKTFADFLTIYRLERKGHTHTQKTDIKTDRERKVGYTDENERVECMQSVSVSKALVLCNFQLFQSK